jgi:hypothetical protein
MPESRDTYLERNAIELERLRAVGAGVLAGDISPRLAGGWTASAVFAHLAFWDRFVIARWDRYDREGVIGDLPDAHPDLVNAAGLPLWLALSGGAAVVQAIDAAIHVCERIAALSPAAVEAAVSSGRLPMLDRTVHWSPHLDELTGAPVSPRENGSGRSEPLDKDNGQAELTRPDLSPAERS